MPPKKAAPQPALPPPPKSSFFTPGSGRQKGSVQASGIKPQQSSFFRKPQFAPRRSFLYDKYTDEPYAEWIGNEAVCLETGEVLFVSKRGDDFGFDQRPAVKFDFSPPAHKHPKDPSISSQDLIDKGILTLEDFRTGKAGLSVEAYNRYMQM